LKKITALILFCILLFGIVSESYSQVVIERFVLMNIVNVKEWGARGDGVKDDTTAFTTSITKAANNILFVPKGTYKITNNVTAGATVEVWFSNGVTLNIANTKTFTVSGRLHTPWTPTITGTGTFTYSSATMPAVSTAGIVAVANGGTGSGVKATAFDNLSPMSALGDMIYGGASGTGTRLVGDITGTTKYLQQIGTGAISAIPTWSQVSLTAGVTGILPIANGGTNKSSWTQWGIPYADTTTSLAQIAAGSAGQVLQSNGNAAQSWSTPTYPSTSPTVGKILRSDGTNIAATTSTFADTYSINTLLYNASANTVSGLATGNSGVLVTSAGGVPSIATDIPTAVTIGSKYAYRAEGTDIPIADGGTGQSTKAPAFDSLSPMSALGDMIYGGASGTGTVLVGDITGTTKYIQQIGTGAVSAIPTWSQVSLTAGVSGVLPTANGGSGINTTGLVVPLTYAGTIACDMSLGTVFTTTTVHATGNATINASNGTAGQKATFLITNDATTGKTITFGTGFVANGTLVGTVNLIATVVFTYNGSSWQETSRAIPTVIKNNQDVSTAGTPSLTGLTVTGNTGLKINDTGADHTLNIKNNEDLGANRILNYVSGDADRTITLSGSPTMGDYFDQAVKQASTPTFASVSSKAFLGTVVPLTYASPISCDTTLGEVFTTTTVNGTGSVSINATTGGTAGQKATFLITNDATTGKTITFGTNFTPNGTLVGTINLTATVVFISNGTSWIEQSRSIPTIIKNNQDVSTAGTPSLTGLTVTGNTGLKINDTGADHTLNIKNNEDLGANRILNYVSGDADRTITLSGSPTMGDYFDQAVKQASTPTFASVSSKAFLGTVVPLTYASPISCDTTLGEVFTTTTVNGTGSVSINATTGGTAGQKATFLITNDATTGKTITFGTNFTPNGTLVGTINLTATVVFISNGTSWIEQSRSIPTIIKNNQDVSSAGTPAFTGLTLTNPLGIAYGGTGQTTKAPAFDALSPITTLGDTIYGGASGVGTSLAGNITITTKYYQQIGTGAVSAAPSWNQVNLSNGVTGSFVNIGLTILDTNADHTLTLKPNENLTGNKTLNLITGDSDRTITLSGNPSMGDYFDQAVKQASSPIFAGLGLGTSVLSNILSIGGGTARTIALERHTTTNTAGSNLTVQAGGATALMAATVSVVAGGVGYSPTDVLTLAQPVGGVSSTVTVATIAATGGLKTLSIVDGGTSYSDGTNVLTVTQGGASGGTISCTASGGVIVSIGSIVTIGTGYSVATPLATTGGGNNDCTVNITAINGAVATVTVTTKGSGYTVGTKTTTVSPSGGTGCTIGVDTLESATDKAGGNLLLKSGISTGTGNGEVQIWTSPAGGSSASDHTLVQSVTINGAGDISNIGSISAGKGINGAVVPLTNASTISCDMSLGNVFTLSTTTAVGNVIVNATNGTTGQRGSFIITDDATGGHTVTFNTGFQAGKVITGIASTVQIVEFVYNGSTWYRTDPGNLTNSGAATITSGNTFVMVTHSLNITPNINNISVTPKNNLGSAAKYWITNIETGTDNSGCNDKNKELVDTTKNFNNVGIVVGQTITNSTDANTGVITGINDVLAFTSGSVAPSVGDVLTGSVSNAHGHVIQVYLLASGGGSWVGTDAAGIVILSGVTGTFQAETVNNTTTVETDVLTASGAPSTGSALVCSAGFTGGTGNDVDNTDAYSIGLTTQFRINVDTDPGANAMFNWQIGSY